MMQKMAAWLTHAFTASGMVAGFAALVAFGEGSPASFREGWMWLVLALAIDGIDGTFARRFRVKVVLPKMDGSMIDAVVDFANYALIPLYFMHKAELLPPGWMAFTGIAVALLASGLYYGKAGMIASDMSFVGFPVLWNLVAFYLYYVCHWPPMLNFVVVLVLSVGHFVPIRYLYPSRGRRWFWPTLLATVVTMGSCLGLLMLDGGAAGWGEAACWWGAVLGLGYLGLMSMAWSWVSR